MPARDVTVAGTGTLQVHEDGDYEICYNIVMSSSRPITVGASVRIFQGVLYETRSVHPLENFDANHIAFVGRLSAMTIVHLPAGALLDLAVEILSEPPSDLNVEILQEANATFSVKRLG